MVVFYYGDSPPRYKESDTQLRHCLLVSAPATRYDVIYYNVIQQQIGFLQTTSQKHDRLKAISSE